MLNFEEDQRGGGSSGVIRYTVSYNTLVLLQSFRFSGN